MVMSIEEAAEKLHSPEAQQRVATLVKNIHDALAKDKISTADIAKAMGIVLADVAVSVAADVADEEDGVYLAIRNYIQVSVTAHRYMFDQFNKLTAWGDPESAEDRQRMIARAQLAEAAEQLS